jgi:ubiquinone/menaquinone biosynthesis C-methylase UbiE
MTTTVKAYKGMGMEGSTARWYDRTTRKDMPEFKALALRIAALVPPGGAVLEVAPGPGFLSIELAKRGLQVRGLDISKTFVQIAQRNAAADGVQARFELGNAALSEMRRVLRPGGTALLIDMRRDVNVGELKRYVDGLGVNLLNRWFMMVVFRGMLIKRAYRLEEIRRMAIEAGWAEPRIDSSPVGFEAWLTKT